MTDSRLDNELARARAAAPAFGLARQQRVIWGVRGRLQPWRPSRAQLALALAALVCLGLGISGLYAQLQPNEAALAARTPGDERWQLRDGSRIVIESPLTVITKQHESTNDVSFDLAAGVARFDVAHRPERTFRIQAGAVRIEVMGTQFRLERQGPRTAVAVQRGRVRVSWPTGSVELGAGETGVFPPQSAPLESASNEAAQAPSATSAASPKAAEPRASVEANAALATRAPSDAGTPTQPSAQALFSSADQARAEGHPLDAVRALQQITERFPRDPRAPLAAFTRGRLLLETLQRPSEAARCFAEARALAGRPSALAEDALAREVDALRAAGNLRAAAERADLYRSLYPSGLRLQHVLRSGGLTTAP